MQPCLCNLLLLSSVTDVRDPSSKTHLLQSSGAVWPAFFFWHIIDPSSAWIDDAHRRAAAAVRTVALRLCCVRSVFGRAFRVDYLLILAGDL
jgi:hypothetical protein